MTRSVRGFVALLPPILLLAGCAHTAYVRGVAGENAPVAVQPGASICVEASPDATEWELNDEIDLKLEKLLLSMGFKATTPNEAEYFLFFEFDRKPLMTRVRYEWLEGVQAGIGTTRKEGPYDLTLGLKLIAKAAYEERRLNEFTWAGGAILAEVPTESPKFVDLLLVAAMRPFPEETGKTVKMRVGLYDPRAKRLRQVQSGDDDEDAD